MPKRNLKFTDRWMFNRVLCEEEVCRKGHCAPRWG